MLRIRIADFLNVAIEALVALLVLGSVWPFGSVQAVFQLILLGGVGIVLVLWAIKAAVLGRPIWKPCLLVTLVLAFCCVPILQIVPMTPNWIQALSPGTARWLQEFRPPPADVPGDPEAARVAAETLTFDAGETRDWLFRLIGFAALFIAVRCNLTAPAAAVRFAWFCIANAALLAIVGIGQMTSSPENVVYWKIPTEGSVFGPFICRNHAAYVLNLAIGLAFGLLLGTRAFLANEPPRGHQPGVRRRRRSHAERPMWVEMLRDPKVAWLLCGIGICVAGLIATLSRGGGLSLLAAGGVGLAALGGRNANRLRWLIVVPIIAVAFAFLAFSGFERVTRRWDKLVDDSVTPESRSAVWTRTAPLIGTFPVFGSGWGTFIEVEPTTRKPGDMFLMAHDYAHNDFLQLWIEGGTLQIAITVLLLIVLYRQGLLAIERHRGTPAGPLALGALVGISAVVFHSFVDFGLHIPAVAALTATVAAFLTCLADPDSSYGQSAGPPGDPQTIAFRAVANEAQGRPFAMVLQVVVLLGIAGYLAMVGYRQHQAERYRIAAQVGAPERRVPYLETAVRFTPDMADPRIELAAAYIERTADRIAANKRLPVEDDPDFRKACPQIAIACRLSPLSFDAQDRLRRAQMLVGDKEAALRTVERLTRISPSEPEPWYLAGRAALGAHDQAAAIRAWRNCLRATPRFLPKILAAMNKELLASPKLRSELFAEDPVLLKKAAEVAVDEKLPDLEEPLLKDAAAALASQADRSPEQDWMLGQIYAKLEDSGKAIDAMRRAWKAQPRQFAWGEELARQLMDAGQLDEAFTICRAVQSQMPPGSTALDPLLNEITLKKNQKGN